MLRLKVRMIIICLILRKSRITFSAYNVEIIMKKILVIIALTIAVAAASACSRTDAFYKDTRVIMGTYVTITAVKGGLSDKQVSDAVNAGFAEISRVDALMSTYKPESQLSMINANAGVAPVKVDTEVIDNVEDAVKIARLTGGAFDPTVGPVVRLWKIGSDDAHVPDPADIKKAVQLVGYENIVVDRGAGAVFLKKKGMSIDLGGIAKGYAADRAVEAMKKKGVKGGIVAVAGDLKLFGRRPDGSPWIVGIQHPRVKDGVLAKVGITDAATSTSGDYERFFFKDGVRYHHILDPRTGYPARGLISVTVIAKQSWLADSMTKMFVMGPVKAKEFAAAHPEIETLMVDSEGKTFATGRFKGIEVAPVTP